MYPLLLARQNSASSSADGQARTKKCLPLNRNQRNQRCSSSLTKQLALATRRAARKLDEVHNQWRVNEKPLIHCSELPYHRLSTPKSVARSLSRRGLGRGQGRAQGPYFQAQSAPSKLTHRCQCKTKNCHLRVGWRKLEFVLGPA